MDEVKVRGALVTDHSEILKLLLGWFEELNIKGFPGMCNYTGLWLADLIANHIVLVAEYANKIIGAIGMRVGYFPWNNEEQILSNEFLMVDKTMRKKGTADLLLKAIKQFADKGKLTVVLGHMTGTDSDLKDRYL